MTPCDILGWSTPIAMWLIFGIFNISIMILIQSTSKSIDMKQVLREKSAPMVLPYAFNQLAQVFKN